MSVIEQLKDSENFFLLAGPCVIEGEEMALRIAERVVKITNKKKTRDYLYFYKFI